MTDPDQSAAAQPTAAAQTVPSEPPPAWKPEPRQWTWKDLFTAPMLAFKPKCMLISAVTLILIGLWWMLFTQPLSANSTSLERQLTYNFESKAWLYLVTWGWWAVTACIFSLGATFVATFLKADLLDDEFLSFKEAWKLYVQRLVPALLVPLFLLLLLTGVWGLIYLGALVCSVPYAGSGLYALLWPLAFAAAVLGVLVVIAVGLSASLFPGIIAVRRHGWFDNVVDTIEAVGTKPHLLFFSLLLTALMLRVVYGIGIGAIDGLGTVTRNLPGQTNQVEQATGFAEAQRETWLAPVAVVRRALNPDEAQRNTFNSMVYHDASLTGATPWIQWGPGLVICGWQTLIIALLLGYCLNLALASGLLTYLWVREDDYWDEEDLQDLDQLAKELEEEAQREQSRGKTQSTSADA